MRIAYVTPYQGSTLVKRRPIVKNRSMSNRTKIELIAQLLRSQGHDIEVLSHGEVIESALRFYPSFTEPEAFHPEIPVHYISSLPVPRLNGFWASAQMVRLLRRRHRASPLDLVIIFNFKRPQIAAAHFARRHGIPVVLEYEDDAFRDVVGESSTGWVTRHHQRTYRRTLLTISGCVAASPHLLDQAPLAIPRLLLRGVVGDDILLESERQRTGKRNIVLFSGTHIRWNGVEELITAWRSMDVPGWELHITGYGELTEHLRRMAKDVARATFHGLVSRQELVSLMCSARICISPQRVSETPGNVFAFKIIEYLAAGAHVVTTPMGVLEADVEAGITYLSDNSPITIAAVLRKVIGERRYESSAQRAVQGRYGSPAVSNGLAELLEQVVSERRRRGE